MLKGKRVRQQALENLRELRRPRREANIPENAPPSTQPVNALDEVIPCITLLY